jgi:Tol biopolymer transport system component
MVHTQVTFSGDVLTASISPDGRSVAYAVEENDAVTLLVQDISGGDAVNIWRGEHIEDVKWMPDNTRVLVSGAQHGRQAV